MTPGRKWVIGGGIFAAFVIAVNVAPETPQTVRPPKTVAIVTPAPVPTSKPSPVAVRPTETPTTIKPNPDAGKHLLERAYNDKPPKTSTSVHAGSSNGPTYGNNFAEPSVREFGNQSGLSWVDVYTFQDPKINRPKTWNDIQNNAK